MTNLQEVTVAVESMSAGEAYTWAVVILGKLAALHADEHGIVEGLVETVEREPGIAPKSVAMKVRYLGVKDAEVADWTLEQKMRLVEYAHHGGTRKAIAARARAYVAAGGKLPMPGTQIEGTVEKPVELPKKAKASKESKLELRHAAWLGLSKKARKAHAKGLASKTLEYSLEYCGCQSGGGRGCRVNRA